MGSKIVSTFLAFGAVFVLITNPDGRATFECQVDPAGKVKIQVLKQHSVGPMGFFMELNEAGIRTGYDS